MPDHLTEDKVRLDKWLWAARFFKTRSLAKHAIEGGKVYYEGQRVKVSKEIKIGGTLRIRQGFDEKTITVIALADKRGNATFAATLYEETEASLELRAQRKAERQASAVQHHDRPNKRDRRKLNELKQQYF